IATVGVVLALFAMPALSDTLVLKNGEKISGYFEGGSARVIKFRTADGAVKDYDLLSVQQIQFGEDKTTAAAPSPRPATTPTTATTTTTTTSTAPSTSTVSRPTNNSADPRLLPKTDRVTQPTSSNAAST